MRDDDDASAHALFSCPLLDEKKFKRDDGDVDATKTTTHLRGDGRKFPDTRCAPPKWSWCDHCVAATNAYMSGMTRCVAHRK